MAAPWVGLAGFVAPTIDGGCGDREDCLNSAICEVGCHVRVAFSRFSRRYLDQAIQVWDQSRQADESAPVFPVSEVMAAARAGQPAVVAVVGNELVGLAVAQAQGERAWCSAGSRRTVAQSRHRQRSAC